MSPRKRKLTLFLGASLVLCLACGLGGYWVVGPATIVGNYQTPPLDGGSARYEWEFKGSGTGSLSVIQKRLTEPGEPEETDGYQFTFEYVRGLPSIDYDPFARRLVLATHYLEIKEVKPEGGKDRGLFPLKTDPAQPQQIVRVAVSEAEGDVWITTTFSGPAGGTTLWWRLKRR